MRKLLIFLGLVLTLSLSGQILPGVVASQRGTASFDGGMIANGNFANGSTGWTAGSGWTIAGGVASYDNTIDNATLTQTDDAMLGHMASNTNYTLTFTISITTDVAKFELMDYTGSFILIATAGYNNGVNVIDFTSPELYGYWGINIRAHPNVSGNAYTITNISLKLR